MSETTMLTDEDLDGLDRWRHVCGTHLPIAVKVEALVREVRASREADRRATEADRPQSGAGSKSGPGRRWKEWRILMDTGELGCDAFESYADADGWNRLGELIIEGEFVESVVTGGPAEAGQGETQERPKAA